MRKMMFICGIITLFVACDGKKSYTYFETQAGGMLNVLEDTKPKTIKALNDSLAYIKAYRDYTISKKTNEIYNKGNIKLPETIAFSLTDNDSNELSSGYFLKDKEVIDLQIELYVDSLMNSLQKKK